MMYKSKSIDRAIRIGVVGHRPNRPLRADLFSAIKAAFVVVQQIIPPGSQVTLLSGLAEGADQVAVSASPAEWTIEAVLPFERNEYENDFAKAADGSGADMRLPFRERLAACHRVTEVASDRRDPDAYLRSGLLMLTTIDLVIAVWDGAAAAGSGGTAEIVASAREAGIPVLWISSTGSDALRLIVGQRADGEVILLRREEEIVATLQRHMAPNPREVPSDALHEHHGPSEREKVEGFFNEPVSIGRGMPVYEWMKSLFDTWKGRGSRDMPAYDAWADLLSVAPLAPNLHAEIASEVEQLYRRSDSLAVHYANNYRSAYVITYFAAFLAVVLALLGLVIPHDIEHSAQINIKAGLVFAELILVAVIIAIVTRGTRSRWHQKWIDYRSLAEMLRHIRFLAFLGGHRRLRIVSRNALRRQHQWMNDLVDAVSSRIGLPDAVIDRPYLAALNSAVRDHEVQTQFHYHARNARTLHGMNHTLHHLGDWCFYLTAALLVSFLALYGADIVLQQVDVHSAAPLETHGKPGGLSGFLYASKAMVGVFAAALPALGAALAGIRFTGEFETLASRSESMAIALLELRKRYGQLVQTPGFDGSTAAIMETAAILSSDVEDWKTLYTSKRLSLPA